MSQSSPCGYLQHTASRNMRANKALQVQGAGEALGAGRSTTALLGKAEGGGLQLIYA